MSFIDKINSLAKSNKKIKMFIDMDGTIIEFVLNNEESFTQDGGYLIKKPLVPIIEQINKIHNLYNNIEINILSCARTNKMVNEKNQWLDKYLPYISKENRIFFVEENSNHIVENLNTIKSTYIQTVLKKDELAILIDDDPRILVYSQKILKDKIIPFHVTSLLI